MFSLKKQKFKIQKLKSKNRSGFSLVELMIVIVIVGVLSMVSYFAIQRSKIRAVNERMMDDLVAIANVIEDFRRDQGDFPMPKTADEDPDVNQNVSCYYTDATYAHDCETATFRQGMIDNNLLPKRYLRTVPTDPHTGSRYVYGVTNDGKFFQVAGIFEADDGVYEARTIENLAKGFELPSIIRAYDGANFVVDQGTYLPFSADHLSLTGTIENKSGGVTVGGEDADNGLVVYQNNIIETDSDGSVDIYFSDGSVTHLDPNTELELKDMTVEKNDADGTVTKILLKLKAGKIWSKVVRLAAASEFKVETNSAIAGVRGTEFSAEDDDTVEVLDGEVWQLGVGDDPEWHDPDDILDDIEEQQDLLPPTEYQPEFIRVLPGIPELVLGQYIDPVDDADYLDDFTHIELHTGIHPHVLGFEGYPAGTGGLIRVRNLNHFLERVNGDLGLTGNYARRLQANRLAVYKAGVVLENGFNPSVDMLDEMFLDGGELGMHTFDVGSSVLNEKLLLRFEYWDKSVSPNELVTASGFSKPAITILPEAEVSQYEIYPSLYAEAPKLKLTAPRVFALQKNLSGQLITADFDLGINMDQYIHDVSEIDYEVEYAVSYTGLPPCTFGSPPTEGSGPTAYSFDHVITANQPGECSLIVRVTLPDGNQIIKDKHIQIVEEGQRLVLKAPREGVTLFNISEVDFRWETQNPPPNITRFYLTVYKDDVAIINNLDCPGSSCFNLTPNINESGAYRWEVQMVYDDGFEVRTGTFIVDNSAGGGEGTNFTGTYSGTSHEAWNIGAGAVSSGIFSTDVQTVEQGINPDVEIILSASNPVDGREYVWISPSPLVTFDSPAVTYNSSSGVPVVVTMTIVADTLTGPTSFPVVLKEYADPGTQLVEVGTKAKTLIVEPAPLITSIEFDASEYEFDLATGDAPFVLNFTLSNGLLTRPFDARYCPNLSILQALPGNAADTTINLTDSSRIIVDPDAKKNKYQFGNLPPLSSQTETVDCTFASSDQLAGYNFDPDAVAAALTASTDFVPSPPSIVRIEFDQPVYPLDINSGVLTIPLAMTAYNLADDALPMHTNNCTTFSPGGNTGTLSGITNKEASNFVASAEEEGTVDVTCNITEGELIRAPRGAEIDYVAGPGLIAVTTIDSNPAGPIAGITVRMIGNTNEDAGTATVMVRLDSPPTGVVTIIASSKDTSEGVVVSSDITFSSTSWGGEQAVTVEGVDDNIADGDVLYLILLTASGADYEGITLEVMVTNVDNETVIGAIGFLDDGGGELIVPVPGVMNADFMISNFPTIITMLDTVTGVFDQFDMATYCDFARFPPAGGAINVSGSDVIYTPPADFAAVETITCVLDSVPSLPPNAAYEMASPPTAVLQIDFAPSAGPACGNGIVDAGEECDGAVGTASCNSIFSTSGGGLSCYAVGTLLECMYDTSTCTTADAPVPSISFSPASVNLAHDGTFPIDPPSVNSAIGPILISECTLIMADSGEIDLAAGIYTAPSSGLDDVIECIIGEGRVVNVGGVDYIATQQRIATINVTFTCGDGTVDASVEQCDDGNTDDNDGCSAACDWEVTNIYFDPVTVNVDGQNLRAYFQLYAELGFGAGGATSILESSCTSITSTFTVSDMKGALGNDDDGAGDYYEAISAPADASEDTTCLIDSATIADLAGLTYPVLAPVSGTLTAEAPVALCGNGTREGSEECDMDDLDSQICLSWSGAGWSGALSCSASCLFDTTGCGLCGDGAVNGDEACDDGNVVDDDGCTNTCTVPALPTIIAIEYYNLVLDQYVDAVVPAEPADALMAAQPFDFGDPAKYELRIIETSDGVVPEASPIVIDQGGFCSFEPMTDVAFPFFNTPPVPGRWTIQCRLDFTNTPPGFILDSANMPAPAVIPVEVLPPPCAIPPEGISCNNAGGEWDCPAGVCWVMDPDTQGGNACSDVCLAVHASLTCVNNNWNDLGCTQCIQLAANVGLPTASCNTAPGFPESMPYYNPGAPGNECNVRRSDRNQDCFLPPASDVRRICKCD